MVDHQAEAGQTDGSDNARPETGRNETRRIGDQLYLYSDLWVDAPDAAQQLERRHAGGELSADQAEPLARLIDRGFAVLPANATRAAWADRLNEEVEDLWRARPRDLAFGRDSPPYRFSLADASDRQARYRLHDIHSHSAAALRLYLDPEIVRLIEVIYGEPAVAIQSLYFEFGSQQVLHRDPVVVPSAPASHLLAAWIALEDISPDCGPLQYVPRSHRLPYYEFAPGQFMFDALTMTGDEATAAMEWDRRQCERAGLVAEPFLARRGEALIWHHSLLHGGAAARDERLTRRSFVVHFCTRRHYRERAITLYEPFAGRAVAPYGEGRQVVYSTRAQVELGDYAGMQNPVAGT